MKNRPMNGLIALTFFGLGLLTFLQACSDSGGGGVSGGDIAPASDHTVVGRVVEVAPATLSDSDGGEGAATVSLDGGEIQWPLDDHGRFEVIDILDGDHSLVIRAPSGTVVEVPIRMLSGRGLDLGIVKIGREGVEEISGFDGYLFGFVDENGDGVNDLCKDAGGDGICDEGSRFANYTYLMNWGWADEDGDGKNDRYRDADGDGANDLGGFPNGFGFGFVDEDGDGVNDCFRDGEGDGICDQSGMPYRVGVAWADADGDGINDNFADLNGDGVNDLTGEAYVALPGWVDLDGDGVNDKFSDANGDGICDLSGIAYGHGLGWQDADGDGVNDAFTDIDGNAVNDITHGPYPEYNYRYGNQGPSNDMNGDGEIDGVGVELRHGFGWVDGDHDGFNDNFADIDGDGVDDYSGCHYAGGYLPDPDGTAETPQADGAGAGENAGGEPTAGEAGSGGEEEPTTPGAGGAEEPGEPPVGPDSGQVSGNAGPDRSQN